MYSALNRLKHASYSQNWYLSQLMIKLMMLQKRKGLLMFFLRESISSYFTFCSIIGLVVTLPLTSLGCWSQALFHCLVHCTRAVQ